MRAPTYQRQVTNETMPSVAVQSYGDSNAFGGGVAKSVGELSNFVTNKADEMQDKNNLEAVQNALTKTTKEMSDYHYNENDGFLHRQGANAKGIANSSKQFSDALIFKYSKDLTNDQQKQAFLKAITPQAQSFYNSAQNHEAQQSKIALKQSSEAMASSYADVAATSYNNPDIADNAFRMGIKGQMASGLSLGMPQEAVNENVKKYSNSVVTDMVKTALGSNDIDGAMAVVKRYGDKLDGGTVSNLVSAINTKAIPIKAKQVSDELFAKYGLNEEKGMAEIDKQFGNTPYFKSFSAAYQAMIVDKKRYKADEEKRNEEDLQTQVWHANSLQETQDLVNNAIESGKIKPGQGLYLINQAKSKFKALTETADTATKQEKKHWATYELNGGLQKHLLQLREYYTLIGEGGEITPKQQTKYDYAASQVNAYKAFKESGGYTKSDALDKFEADGKQVASQQAEASIWQAINDLASKGLGKDEIINRINMIAPKHGFDPSYFIENADWNSQGNKGGVK